MMCNTNHVFNPIIYAFDSTFRRAALDLVPERWRDSVANWRICICLCGHLPEVERHSNNGAHKRVPTSEVSGGGTTASARVSRGSESSGGGGEEQPLAGGGGGGGGSGSRNGSGGGGLSGPATPSHGSIAPAMEVIHENLNLTVASGEPTDSRTTSDDGKTGGPNGNTVDHDSMAIGVTPLTSASAAR